MPVHLPMRPLALALFLTLAACGGSGGGQPDAGGQLTPATITGLPMPQDASIDNGRSIILGAGDRWTGRVSYTVGSSADDMFAFFRRDMPNFGWTELTSVRADTSALTFRSDATGRIANVLIGRGTLWGSKVDVVVSAPSDLGQGGGGSGYSYGAPPAARAPASRNQGIVSQPLR